MGLDFALSTSFFHFLTISLARSETSFESWARSLPTASPALLSYRGRMEHGRSFTRKIPTLRSCSLT